MRPVGQDEAIAALRARIRRIEQGRAAGDRHRAVLPFGLPALDDHLPEGGLARGALHEIMGGGPDAPHGAAAALFAAGLLARLPGPVLWCLSARDLFAPGLAGVGLHPDRVLYAETGTETALLAVMEEGLRHRGLAAVIGELARLSLTASRRLQLAAQASGVLALVLRRRRHCAEAEQSGGSAALTRWRITALPTPPLPAPGLGRPRWRLELLRCRGGREASWIVEACDAQGRLAVPADLADRPHPQAARPAAS